jgi:hypothetical protein
VPETDKADNHQCRIPAIAPNQEFALGSVPREQAGTAGGWRTRSQPGPFDIKNLIFDFAGRGAGPVGRPLSVRV